MAEARAEAKILKLNLPFWEWQALNGNSFLGRSILGRLGIFFGLSAIPFSRFQAIHFSSFSNLLFWAFSSYPVLAFQVYAFPGIFSLPPPGFLYYPLLAFSTLSWPF